MWDSQGGENYLYLVGMIHIEAIRQRFSTVAPFLNERGRRVVAAAEGRWPRLVRQIFGYLRWSPAPWLNDACTHRA